VEVRRDEKGQITEISLNIFPQPKQMEFFNATTTYVAYGGARGGGKSWSVRGKALHMCLNYNRFRVLILRQTYPELKANHIDPLMNELVDVVADSARRYDVTKGRALCVFNKDEKELQFMNGSKIVFGYCDTDADCARYQGHEYDMVFIDEATHFTEYQFHRLSETCRGVNDFPKRVYLTCNPGGVGHGWVKRLFIDREYEEYENPEDYSFIPAFVQDNQVLLERDPGYLRRLEALPYDLRQADLFGNWDIFEGQFFKSFKETIHVIEPEDMTDIPAEWPRFRSLDYGLDMLACYWHAIKPTGEVITYREFFKGELLPSEAAKQIVELTGGEPVEFTYAPPDLWSRTKDRGRSVVEIFFENGLRNVVQSDNAREAGWWDFKEWMRPFYDETGKETSAWKVSRACPKLIAHLKQAQADEKNPSDMSKFPHSITHSCDAMRYFFRSRPRPRVEAAESTDIFTKWHGNPQGTGETTYDGYGDEY